MGDEGKRAEERGRRECVLCPRKKKSRCLCTRVAITAGRSMTGEREGRRRKGRRGGPGPHIFWPIEPPVGLRLARCLLLSAADRCNPVNVTAHATPDTTNTSWYTNVTYSCHPGYEWPSPTSVRTIMCRPGGTWNDSFGHADDCNSTSYDTIYAILTCARKPTRASLIYRTEPHN